MKVAGPADPTVDAVLPLRQADLPRAALLFDTIRAFGLPVRRLHVVVAVAGDVPQVAATLGGLPGIDVRVLSEREALGGWQGGLKTPWLRRWLRRGWYRQQMVKLAVAADGEADVCLTLGSDVLVCRTNSKADLLDQGRARLVEIVPPRHRLWYQMSAYLLDARRLPFEMGVTPALLHRDTCRELLARLGSVAGERGRKAPVDWRDLLEWRWGWTEYSLYATSASSSGRLDRHHVPVAYDDWFAPGVWHRADWPAWRPESFFGRGDTSLFSVVQSSTAVPAEHVRRRVTSALSSVGKVAPDR